LPETLFKQQFCSCRLGLFDTQFQKISIPTAGMVIGSSKGLGGSKAKIFEGKLKAKLKFLVGWQDGGSNKNNHPWGHRFFWSHAMV